MSEQRETIFQCCVCRLPHLTPEQEKRATHGYHETCAMVEQPEFYRATLATLKPGECVT